MTVAENRRLKQELDKLKKAVAAGTDPERERMKEELSQLRKNFEKFGEMEKENLCLKEELKKYVSYIFENIYGHVYIFLMKAPSCSEYEVFLTT